MFEHLDDPMPSRSGTSAQLAAAHNRARVITHERRRSRLAVGSVTLAASAAVSGFAIAGSAAGSRPASGQTGGGGPAGTTPPKPSAAAKAPAAAAKAALKPGLDTSAAAKASKLAAEGLYPHEGEGATQSPKPVCNPALPALSGVAAPRGYSVVDTPTQVGAAYSGTGGTSVHVKVICASLPVSDTTSRANWTVTDAQVAGHAAFLWHHDDLDAGVMWPTASGAIVVQAVGPAGSRLTDAELEAFAATLPTG